MITCQKLTLSDGSDVQCKDINVIVGSNNSGKTTFLREITTYFGQIIPNQEIHWIKSVEIKLSQIKTRVKEYIPKAYLSDFNDVNSNLDKEGLQKIYNWGEWNQSTHRYLINNLRNKSITVDLANVEHNTDQFYGLKFLLSLFHAAELCKERLTITTITNVPNTKQPVNDILHYFYINPKFFDPLMKHIKKVFSLELIFDNIPVGEKALRVLTGKIPKNKPEATETYTRLWDKNTRYFGTLGDGIQAYLKIAFSIFNPVKDIIVLDEPESFLHPPQIYSLASFIYQNSKANKKQIFIATHSAEFIRGLLLEDKKNGSSSRLNIIYLTKNLGLEKFTAETLDVNEIRSSSQHEEQVLNSLFNNITIVCEATDDRVFYQAALNRYLPKNTHSTNFISMNGLPGCLKILDFLNTLKISAACILDSDALYKDELVNFVNDKMNNSNKSSIKNCVSKMKLQFNNKQKKYELKQKGLLAIVDNDLKIQAIEAIKLLKHIGVFILKNGSLESWANVSHMSQRKIQALIDSLSVSNNELKYLIKEVATYGTS
ncbi:MAG: AAA family ATPase [Patescibacteria group bacterium]